MNKRPDINNIDGNLNKNDFQQILFPSNNSQIIPYPSNSINNFYPTKNNSNLILLILLII